MHERLSLLSSGQREFSKVGMSHPSQLFMPQLTRFKVRNVASIKYIWRIALGKINRYGIGRSNTRT